jgi:bifunctional NMN adenylyltransferase/nudix hydrolase
MIEGSFPREQRERIRVLPLEDSTYNDSKWIQNVQTLVAQGAFMCGLDPATAKVTLVGHSRDNTSYYLKLFPQWHNTEVASFRDISGTNIRNSYFSNMGHMWIRDADGHRAGDLPQDAVVTPHVQKLLSSFLDTPGYKLIRDEYEFVLKYKASWAAAPYPVNLVCVDAVVIKSGFVLMVERGAMPGKGQLALPGGYLNVTERVVDGMIRELREETRLKVPVPVLKGSIVKKEIFDDPHRSSRGRVLTVAYLIDLGTGPLDTVKGGDDAALAKWVALKDLRPESTFEDHWYIIQSLTGI